MDEEEIERLAELARTPRPPIGDAGYLEQMFAALVAGEITEKQWHRADRTHRSHVARRTG